MWGAKYRLDTAYNIKHEWVGVGIQWKYGRIKLNSDSILVPGDANYSWLIFRKMIVQTWRLYKDPFLICLAWNCPHNSQIFLKPAQKESNWQKQLLWVSFHSAFIVDLNVTWATVGNKVLTSVGDGKLCKEFEQVSKW